MISYILIKRLHLSTKLLFYFNTNKLNGSTILFNLLELSITTFFGTESHEFACLRQKDQVRYPKKFNTWNFRFEIVCQTLSLLRTNFPNCQNSCDVRHYFDFIIDLMHISESTKNTLSWYEMIICWNKTLNWSAWIAIK